MKLKILEIASCPLLTYNGEPLELSSPTQTRNYLRESLKGAKIPVEVQFVLHAISETVQIDAQSNFDILYYCGYGREDGSLCFEDEFWSRTPHPPIRFSADT